MGVQRIDATSFTLAMQPDSSACLTLHAGTGMYEVRIAGELWGRLAQSAGWFERAVDQSAELKRLSDERDAALLVQKELQRELERALERVHVLEEADEYPEIVPPPISEG